MSTVYLALKGCRRRSCYDLAPVSNPPWSPLRGLLRPKPQEPSCFRTSPPQKRHTGSCHLEVSNFRMNLHAGEAHPQPLHPWLFKQGVSLKETSPFQGCRHHDPGEKLSKETLTGTSPPAHDVRGYDRENLEGLNPYLVCRLFSAFQRRPALVCKLICCDPITIDKACRNLTVTDVGFVHHSVQVIKTVFVMQW